MPKLVVIFLLVFFSVNTIAEDLWIDVRSSLEHAIDNIEGDMRISYDEVVEEISKTHPDKNIHIKLYCRSGQRAGKAMTLLQQAGYLNVSNAGGIDDARTIRGIK